MRARSMATYATIVLTVALIGGEVRHAPTADAQQLSARCTSSRADSAMIGRTIAQSQPGDRIVFQGTCLLTKTIMLRGDRSYEGESRTGTVLRQAPNTNLSAMLASDSYLDNQPKTGTPVAIRHLSIDGNRSAGNPDTSGLVLRSWLTKVEDVYLTGNGVDGIRLSNPSANGSLLQNTSVNGSITGSMIEDSGRYGVYVRDPGNSLTDWSLLDNYIAGAGVDGLHLDNAAGWMIERNHVYGVRETAVHADRLWGTTIADNYLEDFGSASKSGTYYSIYGSNQGDESASTISGNRIFNFGGETNAASTYIYLAVRQNYGDGVISVSDNVLRGAGTPNSVGLSYRRGDGDSLAVGSTDNIVTDIGTPRVVGDGVSLAQTY